MAVVFARHKANIQTRLFLIALIMVSQDLLSRIVHCVIPLPSLSASQLGSSWCGYLPISCRFKRFPLGSIGSPASSSSSSSRSTRTVSGEGADDEYEDDDDDFLGSASDIWNRFNSAQSENETRFYNHPDALYKFISEEDTSRTEVKITLGIADRLNLPTKLKHILRVLYTRKNSDKAARSFLKRLPAGLLDDALDVEGLVQCNPMVGACQTL